MQMMSNPNLMRMASESMKTMRHAAEQLKHTRPEEMAEIGEKMTNALPEEIAAMRTNADAQISYELSAAQMLKNQGNELQKQGRFDDASEKYLLDAILDLSKAHEVYPGDETIADVLRDAEERLAREGSHQAPQDYLKNESGKNVWDMTANSECLEALKNDPEALSRSFQKFISNADLDTLSALSSGKTATNMIGKMSPKQLQKMVQLASSFQGENPYTSPLKNGFRPGSVHPNVTPDMLKSATDMMTKMPPEELQKMFEPAASLKGNDSISTSTAGLDSDAEVKYPEFQTASVSNGINGFGETSSSSRFPNPMSSQSDLPTSTADLQEQMGNQMKDPTMRQMFASMMKNMSPDIMANMGEQFGLKLSREDAKEQQAMASLSPEELDRKMRWADRIRKGAEGAKKAKNWLLGKPGMILALCMLILAVVLHRLGFIGFSL
ncbi:hypothetical protein E1A91_A05G082200v1 [Gossypium mustelinum]|uniref:Outer envelope protein 61 n=1 Tax=Gossypium mustelinum TaxID=34275 RepID=A0A5D2Z6Q5_GOSMU|nr:hypothetical protein E1A91_A05G082200v1 [Gossypium mustelinum]